ncbi:MAG: FAD-dependent oxidoreductase [Oscillospiraceae bacterium]|nr:FAD-dependent oxidoreductase [Oscillospiraceae bacterium]
MKKLKKSLALLCALAMVCSLAACGKDKEPETTGIYTPGTYEGTAQGFGGTVTAKITVDANAITDVVLEGPGETESVGGAALPTLVDQIKEKGADIDGVAGATVTSNAVKDAVGKALALARGEELPAAGAMKAGTYTAAAKGQNGDVTVEVTVDETSIKAVTVKEHTETYGVGCGLSTTPIETIPGAIVAAQSLAVDSVTSATVTSAAIKAAVSDCITQAGGDPANFQTPVDHNTADETYDTDILVVGAGAAGLAAALSAQEAGANVMVMEKTGITGGSTTRSGGKVLAAGTKWQEAQDFTDNADMMYDYLMSFDRDGLMDGDLVKQFCDASLENIMWLSDRGVNFINVEPIHSSITPWRVHNVTGGGGQTNGHGGQIMVPLTNTFEKNGGKIIYECAAKELLTNADGAVVGVVGEKTHGGKVTINAKNVILATGGFAHSEDEYLLPYKSFLPSNAASGVPMGNVGDGLRMATAIGAKQVVNPGMQLVHVNYDCYIGINEESGLIVDMNGERFVDEWTYQSHVSSAAARRNSPAIFYITSTKDGVCAEPYAMVQWGVTIESPNFSYKASSLEELAGLMDVDAETLISTVERYNALCAKGKDDDFGKPADYLIPVEGDTYYAFKMLPGSSVTFGGLQLDSAARVLDTNDQPIPGLYAAGEVAFGGLFGDEYPCCGMAIGAAVYFGRTAVDTILNGAEAPVEPSEEPSVEPTAEPTKAPEETKTPEASKAPEATPTPEPTPEPTPAPAAGIYNPGTYTGTGAGFGGDVIVTITVDDNNITSVTVTGDSETAAIGGAALGTLADQIKAAQSADIDGVSGASVTSGAAKDAAAEALGKAKR